MYLLYKIDRQRSPKIATCGNRVKGTLRACPRQNKQIAKDRHFFRGLHTLRFEVGPVLGLIPTVDMQYQHLFGIVMHSYGVDCYGKLDTYIAKSNAGSPWVTSDILIVIRVIPIIISICHCRQRITTN